MSLRQGFRIHEYKFYNKQIATNITVIAYTKVTDMYIQLGTLYSYLNSYWVMPLIQLKNTLLYLEYPVTKCPDIIMPLGPYSQGVIKKIKNKKIKKFCHYVLKLAFNVLHSKPFTYNVIEW